MVLEIITTQNISLDNEDISILHQILDKGKMFSVYGESSKNYKKGLDPEHHPLNKITILCQDMGNLCSEGYKRFQEKLGK